MIEALASNGSILFRSLAPHRLVAKASAVQTGLRKCPCLALVLGSHRQRSYRGPAAGNAGVGAPQEGFSRHILRIRSRTSREMTGRPSWPCRTFQVQKRRKPLRCQATTVSGRTMANAERQPLQMRDSQTHNRRSTRVNFGRFLMDR
jgi:hypothetical protein